MVSYSLYRATRGNGETEVEGGRPLPCIVSDMDGVIVKGDVAIGDAPKVVAKLISGD